jgi:DNA excision repair protein ERCC-1
VIQKDLGNDYLSRINAALTSVRGVNKTDVKTLGDRWGPPGVLRCPDYALSSAGPAWMLALLLSSRSRSAHEAAASLACPACRFGSVGGIFKASAEELQACPGIGPTKARRLHETFHQPFRRSITASSAAAAAAGAGGGTAAAAAAGAGAPPVGQQQQQAAGVADAEAAAVEAAADEDADMEAEGEQAVFGVELGDLDADADFVASDEEDEDADAFM